MRSYADQLSGIIKQYVDAGKPWPASARAVAKWAIDEGLWAAQHSDLINQCAQQISRAMREEYYHDPQGRTVRTKHAARTEKDGVQTTLWADIRTATPNHMRIAFQQRRQQVVGDCKQLKADVDSYNENAKPDEPIQMVLDFTLDVAEAAATQRPSARRTRDVPVTPPVVPATPPVSVTPPVIPATPPVSVTPPVIPATPPLPLKSKWEVSLTYH